MTPKIGHNLAPCRHLGLFGYVQAAQVTTSSVIKAQSTEISALVLTHVFLRINSANEVHVRLKERDPSVHKTFNNLQYFLCIKGIRRH